MIWFLITLMLILAIQQFIILVNISDIKDDINYIIFKLPNRRKNKNE